MNLKDLDALRTECELARELGCVGKMAIHPTQVEVMHEVFSPTAEEIEYAQGLAGRVPRGRGPRRRRREVPRNDGRLCQRATGRAHAGAGRRAHERRHRCPRSAPHGSVPPPATRRCAPWPTCTRSSRCRWKQRITRWDFALNLLDGCRHDPQRAALHVTDNGDLDGPLADLAFAELEARSLQIANLLRAQRHRRRRRRSPSSAPRVPALFATMIGGLLAARPFPINWMLDAPALARPHRAVGRQGRDRARADAGFRIWRERRRRAGQHGRIRRGSVHAARPVRARRTPTTC